MSQPKKRAAAATATRTAKSGMAEAKDTLPGERKTVNLKDSPFAEYLHLLPNGEPSYMTLLILRKAVESLGVLT